jgi:hypothetical protein
MDDGIKRFRSSVDDCVYFYNERLRSHRKICAVPSYGALPQDVKTRIVEAKKEAAHVLSMPSTE